MKKIYFLSDAHLGSLLIPNHKAHEQRLLRFLDKIKHDAAAVYLLGDMFDFWFEYRNVVPKGFVRFQGKLAELADRGIEVHFFTGNHDIWTFGYLEQEIGLQVHSKPEELEILGKRFFLAHGDNLDGRNLVNNLFHNRFLQQCFTLIPSRIGVKLGYWWSKKSRLNDQGKDFSYKGENCEPLVLFAKNYLQKHPTVDYFVFGHRHLMLDLQLVNRSRCLIIGDWFEHFSCAVFDGKDMWLENC
ncbi:MAG: UDP-2,3-diacylglucosamine diphosphatase [Prevotellaceae bacterium]|jgi:UDP-2,3-diacylglucosamine hydrolase|nr:UDP-2,3-diacylglucosamine diphosphatase [Prevotellaceae bacterium]